MDKQSSDTRFALIIDADNVSAKYISVVLDELSKYGTVTYKRIYGDWTSTLHSKWKDTLLDNSITPIQQFSYTQGKNATDHAMIIDAMDILYTGKVDGFCIVSSDSDFTRLAARIRESGLTVIGMGEKKTPLAFRKACDIFTTLELLLNEVPTQRNHRHQGHSVDGPAPSISKERIESAVVSIVTDNQNNGRTTGLGEVGSRLQKRYADFDVRNYGTNQLRKLLDEFESVRVVKEGNSVTVLLTEDAQSNATASGGNEAPSGATSSREKDAQGQAAQQPRVSKQAKTASAADASEDGAAEKAKGPQSRKTEAGKGSRGAQVVKDSQDSRGAQEPNGSKGAKGDKKPKAMKGAQDSIDTAASSGSKDAKETKSQKAAKGSPEKSAQKNGAASGRGQDAASEKTSGQPGRTSGAPAKKGAPPSRDQGGSPERKGAASAKREEAAGKRAQAPKRSGFVVARTDSAADSSVPTLHGVRAYLRSELAEAGAQGVSLPALGKRLRAEFPGFEPHPYGFAKLSDFASAIVGVTIEKRGRTSYARLGND